MPRVGTYYFMGGLVASLLISLLHVSLGGSIAGALAAGTYLNYRDGRR